MTTEQVIARVLAKTKFIEVMRGFESEMYNFSDNKSTDFRSAIKEFILSHLTKNPMGFYSFRDKEGKVIYSHSVNECNLLQILA